MAGVKPDVHVAGHGRSTDIEPILVIGGKLLPGKSVFDMELQLLTVVAIVDFLGLGSMKADYLATELENQPVVGLHKVNPLWHLHLARPDKVAHGELFKSSLKEK